MFGEDPFTGIEDLFSQLSGSRRAYKSSQHSQAQNLLSTVESKEETSLVFDLSGKKISSVKIFDNLETNEYGEKVYSGEKNLVIKFSNNEVLKYNLPESIARRKISHTFINGILEVSFKK